MTINTKLDLHDLSIITRAYMTEAKRIFGSINLSNDSIKNLSSAAYAINEITAKADKFATLYEDLKDQESTSKAVINE